MNSFNNDENKIQVDALKCKNCGAKLKLESEKQKLIICPTCREQNQIYKQTFIDKVLNFAERRMEIKRQDELDKQLRLEEEQRRQADLERQREEEERQRQEELERKREQEEKERLQAIEKEKEEKRQRRAEWFKKYWWVIVLIVMFCLIYSLICDMLGIET